MFEFELRMNIDEIDKKDRYFQEGPVDIFIVNMQEGMSKGGRNQVIVSLELIDSANKKGKFTFYLSVDFKIIEFLKAVCSTREEYEKAKSLFLQGKFDFLRYVDGTAQGNLKYEKDDKGDEWPRLYFKPVKYESTSLSDTPVKAKEGAPFNDDITF